MTRNLRHQKKAVRQVGRQREDPGSRWHLRGPPAVGARHCSPGASIDQPPSYGATNQPRSRLSVQNSAVYANSGYLPGAATAPRHPRANPRVGQEPTAALFSHNASIPSQPAASGFQRAFSRYPTPTSQESQPPSTFAEYTTFYGAVSHDEHRAAACIPPEQSSLRILSGFPGAFHLMTAAISGAVRPTSGRRQSEVPDRAKIDPTRHGHLGHIPIPSRWEQPIFPDFETDAKRRIVVLDSYSSVRRIMQRCYATPIRWG